MPIFNAITSSRPPSGEQSETTNDHFTVTNGSRETARRLLSEFRGHGRLAAAAAISGLLSSAAYLLAPSLLGRAIDCLAGVGRVEWPRVYPLLAGLAFCYLFGATLQWLLQATNQTLGAALGRDLRARGFNQITRLPLKILDEHPRGDLISRLTADLDALTDGVNQLLNQLFSGLPLLIGSLALMLTISVPVALLVVALIPFGFLVTSKIAHKSHRYFTKQAADLGAVNTHIEENLANLALIQACGAEKEKQAKFAVFNQNLYASGQKAQFYSSLTNPGTRFVNNVTFVMVAVMAALLALDGRLSVGQMTALLSYALQFARPINEISSVSTQLQNSFAGAARLYALLDAPVEEEPVSSAEFSTTESPATESSYAESPAARPARGHIRFENVDFSYRKDRPLIQNLTLDVHPAAMVAIVGPTGAGKTTLVNLLMRFYEPDAGRILLDGQDIAQLSRQLLRQHIGMVLQDTGVFSGTIHQNIAYGKADATRAEVEAAAHCALADGFIRRLPQSYDTVLRNNGAELSTGQRQLLTIARVFLAAPELLILDEATAAIDSRSEMLVQRAFLALMHGRTSFVIAHRLSTIREASHILVMDEGRIVEQGTHETLMAAGGFYAELYDSQYRQTGSH